MAVSCEMETAIVVEVLIRPSPEQPGSSALDPKMLFISGLGFFWLGPCDAQRVHRSGRTRPISCREVKSRAIFCPRKGDSVDANVAELLGTFILVLLGNGVVANVCLKETKGFNAGWIVITAGWGFAVYTAVLCVENYSGAHLNPAVTVGLAAAGEFKWADVGGYIVAQLAGAFLGAVLVYVLHRDHYAATEDADAKLGTFSTSPAIRNLKLNTLTEAIATFVLVFAVLSMTDPVVERAGDRPFTVGLGSIGAVRVGLVVFTLGMALGGPTGYAINPARDLGPRIAHAILPISGKRDSDWGYAAVPVIGPILGGLLAGAIKLYVLNG